MTNEMLPSFDEAAASVREFVRRDTPGYSITRHRSSSCDRANNLLPDLAVLWCALPGTGVSMVAGVVEVRR